MELIKDDIYRWIGGFLVVFGLFGIIAYISSATFLADESQDVLIGISGTIMCTVLFLIPGIILLIVGIRVGRTESDQEKLAGYLKAYRRMSIKDAAIKLETTEDHVEQLMVECVRLGLVDGFIDRQNKEFVNEDAQFSELLNKVHSIHRDQSTKVSSESVAPVMPTKEPESDDVSSIITLTCPSCFQSYNIPKSIKKHYSKCPSCGAEGLSS
jgi:hypothetical protein